MCIKWKVLKSVNSENSVFLDAKWHYMHTYNKNSENYLLHISLLSSEEPFSLQQLYWHSVLICSFSGAKLATASGDTTVKIWDFSKAECVHTFMDHTHAG